VVILILTFFLKDAPLKKSWETPADAQVVQRPGEAGEPSQPMHSGL
jgi:hypothetical protein